MLMSNVYHVIPFFSFSKHFTLRTVYRTTKNIDPVSPETMGFTLVSRRNSLQISSYKFSSCSTTSKIHKRAFDSRFLTLYRIIERRSNFAVSSDTWRVLMEFLAEIDFRAFLPKLRVVALPSIIIRLF